MAHNRSLSGNNGLGHALANTLTLAVGKRAGQICRFAEFLTSGGAGENAQGLVVGCQWIVENLHFFHDSAEFLADTSVVPKIIFVFIFFL